MRSRASTGFTHRPYSLAMGFYGEQVLPRIINKLGDTKAVREVRDETCKGLHGDVIEVGFGSGLSVPHLPSTVSGVWAVEPSETAMKLAQSRVDASPIPVKQAGLDGEKLEESDDRFDAALSFMTLCTIPDANAALGELRRVLKPGAEFHFAEHGRSPDEKVARNQDRFNPLENMFVGGCNLNREIDALITGAGFEITRLRNFYLKGGGPKTVSYMYVGAARNP